MNWMRRAWHPLQWRVGAEPDTRIAKSAGPMTQTQIKKKVKTVAMEKPDGEQAHRRHVIKRLARIEGQIRGIQAMIEDDRPCEQVAVQMTAARRALDKAFYEMIACSLTADIDAAADMHEVRNSTQKMTQLLTKFG